MISIFNDFKLEKKVSNETIEKYKNKVPKELIEVWRKYGFGSLLNGYLKIVNPEDYKEVLVESYIQTEDEPIEFTSVIFATGMGDLLIWEYVDEEYGNLVLLNYRKGKYSIIDSSLEFFFDDLQSKNYLEKYLDWNPYTDVTKKLGIVSYEECFGYVPLLALGGKEKVENLPKVKLKEQIYIITDLVGPIAELESRIYVYKYKN